MIIYNQTSTTKKYVGGILIGLLIIPAIFLFIKGLIIYGVVLIIIYLAFETSRTGVDFDFGESKLKGFREILFFIKIQQGKSTDLDSFSHYRLSLQNDQTNVSANWAQQSTVSQEYHSLELFDKHQGEFLEIIKSDVSQIEPLLNKLEEQNIVLES